MSETLIAPAAGEGSRRVTREEYQSLPEGPPYYELIGGELVEMTRPFGPHNQIFTLLIELLGPYVRRTVGGLLSPEPNLYLPGTDSVYQPDLVYVAPERSVICLPDGIHGVPDLICEILSPTTRRTDRYVKLEEFCRAGIPHVWLVEPERPVAVEEYVLHEGRYLLNRTVEAPAEWEPVAFPGWRLPLAELDAAVADLDECE